MNKLDHTKYSISSALTYSNCNMISPGYRYTKDDNFRREKIERKGENITKLEGLVSQTMKEKYQNSIAETLEDSKPILYIDCAQKGDLDIMLFMLKEYEKISPVSNKDQIIAKIIETRSIIIEPDQRKDYITTQQPNSEEIINHYNTLLQQRLVGLQPDHINYILSCENDVALAGLGALMEQGNKRHIYLYLDTTKQLSIGEQTRINFLLYARGGIDHDKWIHLKINNGDNSRKTRTASNGQRIQSIHDYVETNIYEEDIIEEAQPKDYNRTLDFKGLSYEEKQTLWEDFEDMLVEKIYEEEKIQKANTIIKIIKEILKNTADHSNSNAQIYIKFSKEHESVKVHFLVQDDGPGLPFTEDELLKNFKPGTTPDRIQKGETNRKIGLGIIKDTAIVANIDLILHNQGKVYHLNDHGLQREVQAKEKFGYEGIGFFDREQ